MKLAASTKLLNKAYQLHDSLTRKGRNVYQEAWPARCIVSYCVDITNFPGQTLRNLPSRCFHMAFGITLRFSTSFKQLKKSSFYHPRRNITSNNGFLRISEEVREALNAKRPVVALETTVYTHGWS